jgi:tetratricopeptide (TPR) repeat protein
MPERKIQPLRSSSAGGWILSRFWDLTLFIGSPLLVIAAFAPLRAWVRSEHISLWLLAFFTFGHHLPGFLRVYGDRELFAQYRLRFLLAPPVVFAATLWFDARQLHGLLLLVFTWDIWHVLMQQYGFLRLYDEKLGFGGNATTARLDWALALGWYATFIAISPHYGHDFLYRIFSAGVPILPPAAVSAAQAFLMTASAAITVAWIAWQARHPLNWRKIAALAAFLFASWYLYVGLGDFIAGFAIWSAFHCLQYFGIVWAWNRKRAGKPGALAPWVRWLFQPRGWLIACYSALILLYGSINYGARLIEGAAASRLLMAFVITSGALHYYFDAFIWKLRPPERTHGWRSPGFAQAAAFLAGLAVLAALEWRRPNPDPNVREALAALAPGAAVSHLNWGDYLRHAGRMAEARDAYSRAAGLDPRSALARHQLGFTLAALGERRAAAEAFQAAVDLDPALTEARSNASRMWTESAGEELARGDHTRAMLSFGYAAAATPNDASVRANYGNMLMLSGRLTEARHEYEAALAADSRSALAHNNLGLLLVRMGDAASARPHLEFALAHGDETIRRSARRALERN